MSQSQSTSSGATKRSAKSKGGSPPAETPMGVPASGPATSMFDPRVVQILSTEHWSLLSARSLAYNEAFTRGGMFLTFMSMSFVALALLAQVTSFSGDFLVVAAILLGFDLIVGLATYGRVLGANGDDFRALHGMNRIRHAYSEVAPIVEPYFTASIHDDRAGVMVSYGSPPDRGVKAVLYALTTSSGMIGLIVSVLGGVLTFVITLLLGGAGALGFVIAAASALTIFGTLAVSTARYFADQYRRIEVMFPSDA